MDAYSATGKHSEYLPLDPPTDHTLGQHIDGWMLYDELRWLHTQAQSMRSIVEIGSYKGRSTFALCMGCPGIVYAVDTFQGSPEHTELEDIGTIHEQFHRNMRGFINLRVFPMSSREAAKSPLIPPKVDMVFLDGAHDAKSVEEDLNLWLPRATKLLCGHDVYIVAEPLAKRFKEVDGGAVSIWSVNPTKFQGEDKQ